jgi:hypothetical protein
MGENRTVSAAITILKKRILEPGKLVPPARIEGMTVFDASAAVIAMDDDPRLHVRGDQAARMLAILSSIVEPLKTVKHSEQTMADTLRENQIKWIQSHMDRVTAAKRGAFFGGNDGPYRDPLIWYVIQLVERKLHG